MSGALYKRHANILWHSDHTCNSPASQSSLQHLRHLTPGLSYGPLFQFYVHTQQTSLPADRKPDKWQTEELPCQCAMLAWQCLKGLNCFSALQSWKRGNFCLERLVVYLVQDPVFGNNQHQMESEKIPEARNPVVENYGLT